MRLVTLFIERDRPHLASVERLGRLLHGPVVCPQEQIVVVASDLVVGGIVLGPHDAVAPNVDEVTLVAVAHDHVAVQSRR